MKKTLLILTIIFLLVCPISLLASCGDDEPPAPKEMIITVTSSDDTLGTVSGGGTYPKGYTFTITATPKEGCRFLKWNDGNTDAERSLYLENDSSFTALFERIPEPTRITSIYLPSLLYWGQTGFLDPNREIVVYYDNDTTETVTASDLEISDYSTDKLGSYYFTVRHNGFEYKSYYSVDYKEIDDTNVVVKDFYLIDEPLSVSGYVIAKGENGLQEKINVTNEKIKFNYFDSSDVTYKNGKETKKTVIMNVANYRGNSSKFNYSVWYGYDGEKFSSSRDYDIYTLEINDFTINKDGSYAMILIKNKHYDSGKTTYDYVYEESDARFMSWEQNTKENYVIDLYYKKNALAKKQLIGTYNTKYRSLRLEKEIFDTGLMKIELLEDPSFTFYRD